MRALLLLLWTGLASAQSGSDGLPLLRAVADNFRNLTAYSVEGHFSLESNSLLGAGEQDLSFRVASRFSRQLRVEFAGGEKWITGLPFVAVCDGPTGWVYYEKIKMYEKVNLAGWMAGYCAPGTLSGFEHVADNVRSAVITGASQAQFEGRLEPCVVVEALYRVIEDVKISPGVIGKIGRVSRKMCIDEGRKLILTDRLEADEEAGSHPPHIVEAVSYDRIERNPRLSPVLFEFHPPEGFTEMHRPKEPTSVPDSRPRPCVNCFTEPEPVSLERPEYSQEAWDEGIQGKVILLVDVDPEGNIRNIKVRDSLGWGLDEKAIETVRNARFTPASKGGQSVEGTAWVEITFSLPDKRPDLPSVGPVARPKPSPWLPSTVLKPPTDLDDFFNVVATNFKSAAACERIDALAHGGGGGDRRGFEVQTLQSKCYLDLAVGLHDAKLCDRVTPVRVGAVDGSGFDKEYCLNLTGLGHDFVSGRIPNGMEGFARVMQKLGYDDAQIAQWRARREPSRPQATITPADYWEFVEDLALWGSDRDRAEFVRQALSLR